MSPYWSIRDADHRELDRGYPMFPVIMRGRLSVGQAQDIETASYIVYACNKQGGHSMTEYWHRHEVEDDTDGMEHNHEGGDSPHQHEHPQSRYNIYIGTIDTPNDDAAVAEEEAKEATAEHRELTGDAKEAADTSRSPYNA